MVKRYRTPPATVAARRAFREGKTCSTPGCNRPAKLVDHVVPLADGGSDTPANWDPKCWPCHSRKTAAKDGGFGNPRQADKTISVPGATFDGRPRDPSHHWNRGKGKRA